MLPPRAVTRVAPSPSHEAPYKLSKDRISEKGKEQLTYKSADATMYPTAYDKR